MKISLRVVVSFFILLNTGCFFGTFQTAQTIPPGEVNYGWYATFPVYFSKVDKDTSKARGYGAFVTPNIGGYLVYGASPTLNFGLRGSAGEGIGPFGKFRFLSESFAPISGAAIFSLGYHPVAQGISGRVDLVFSRQLSPYSSIYYGATYLRSPDYRRLAYKVKVREIEEFKYFWCVFAGVDLNRELANDSGVGIPFGMTLELSLPLVKYPALFFGFQIKR